MAEASPLVGGFDPMQFGGKLSQKKFRKVDQECDYDQSTNQIDRERSKSGDRRRKCVNGPLQMRAVGQQTLLRWNAQKGKFPSKGCGSKNYRVIDSFSSPHEESFRIFSIIPISIA
jgi:hypothetical protein